MNNPLAGMFASKPANTTVPPVEAPVTRDKKNDETYQVWGARYAGMVSADLLSLKPALDSAHLTEKKKQEKDIASQEKHKVECQKKIDIAENKIGAEQKKKEKQAEIKDEKSNEIRIKQQEITDIKEGKGNRRLAGALFYIFAIISFGLGIYLYLFYGSAAYSAFFADSESINSVNEALFNSRAFTLAWAHGIISFFLIILFPTIFVALGLMLHSFSQKLNNAKYFWIGLLFFVAFIFDALIAYKISEMFYIPTNDAPNYTMSMAFESSEFWFVIFCGFVSYIIWGLVFGQAMTYYQEKSEGTVTIKRLEREISDLKTQIDNIDNKISNIDKAITDLNNQKISLQNSIANSVWVDYGKVKQSITNFFMGWLGQMNLLGKSDAEKNEANTIFNNYIQNLTTTTTNSNPE